MTEADEKMKIAYLVQTHRNPKLLKRKIEVLSSEDCAFFIHIDGKSNIKDFSSIKGGNVFFADKRVPVYWAEYSMVEAILILIRQALDAPQKYDYFVLSTGSDYPLRSREYIHDFFDKNRGKEFIGTIKLPDGEACQSSGTKLSGKGCAGYVARKYYSNLNIARSPSKKPLSRIVLKILSRLGFVRRNYKNHLGTLEPYAGNAGWALTGDACRYILDFAENNKLFCKFFEKTFAPDEMFFHTILGNSMFKSRIYRHLTYEDWSAETEHSQSGHVKYPFLERSSNKGGHPALMTEKHINFFENNEKVILDDIYGSAEMLFARKFSDNNLDLLSKIESMIIRKERPGFGKPGKDCRWNITPRPIRLERRIEWKQSLLRTWKP